MPKCYAFGMFEGRETHQALAAVEKDWSNPSLTLDGEPLETVAPGLARHDHYTGPWQEDQLPRNSQVLLARLWWATCGSTWSEQILCDLPYVHVFGILRLLTVSFGFLACSIKGGAETGKVDWRAPGAVWARSFER